MNVEIRLFFHHLTNCLSVCVDTGYLYIFIFIVSVHVGNTICWLQLESFSFFPRDKPNIPRENSSEV